MSQQFTTTDVLRLEVEEDPTGLVNLVQNPSGELGGWGWVTPVAGSHLDGDWTTMGKLRYSSTATSPAGHYFYTEPLPVAAGQYVAARFVGYSSSPGLRYRLDWLDASQTEIGSTSWVTVTGTSATTEQTRTLSPALAPASTVYARLRIEKGSSTGTFPWTTGYGGAVFVKEVTVAKAATSGELASLAYIEPVSYHDVLGPTHDIKVNRETLNVGTLTATILDSTLDPSESALIRPGRRCRLTALVGGAWEPIFTGKVTQADVTYHLKDPNVPESKRARITLTAIDSTQTLANASRPDGVATIEELPYVLEGAGLPWNVNGSGNQVPVATVVSVNENATAVDQIAVTRDSVHGHAWVDRHGVVQAWDAAELGTTPDAVLDDDDYSDLDVSFSTADAINEATVTLLRENLATGQTVEVVYGPYRDAASIAEWGTYRAEFTVHGLTDSDAAMSAFADAVFAANAIPRVRVNKIVLPIAETGDLSKALIDTHALVNVVNTAKGIDEDYRVGTIEHSITSDKWLVTLTFSETDAVAQPQVTPPVPVIEPFTQDDPDEDTTLTPTHASIVSGSIRVRKIAPNTVAAIGYVDVDTNIGTGYINTGMVVPAGLRPSAQVLQPYAYYNSTAQYRYRIQTTGEIEFQQSGVDPTFASLNLLWHTD